MKTRNLLLTSLLTVAVVGLFGAVLATGLLPRSANAVQVLAGHLGAHQGGAHAHWHSHACTDADRARVIALASAWVSISLDLSEDQETALSPVLDVVGRWHDEAGVFCEHPTFADAPDALNRMDTLLDRSRQAMDELRPAFTQFYATLTVEQQARLNDWIRAHHGDAS